MTLDEVALKLEKGVRRTIRGGPGIRARCPAHDDQTASFAVWQGKDDYLHFNCQAGCTEEQILAALSMTQKDRRILGPVASTTGQTVYRYTDKMGAYLFEKSRGADKGGKKTFYQRIAQADGKYLSNLSSLNGQSKTLYRLAEVLGAVASGETIYINEGEKAVEAFRMRGYVATCQPAGAGPGKWLDQHTNVLRGSNCVIVADRDQVGECYAKEVYNALESVCKSVTVVQSKTTGDHDDAYDHFASGHKAEQFVLASHLMALDIAGMFTYEANQKFETYEVDYLWEPYFFFGQSCLFVADSGVGKSTLLIAICAGLSVGQLPNGGGACAPIKTAYFIGDSDPVEAYETLYRANGGKPGMVAWIKDPRPLNGAFKSDVRKLAKAGYRNIVLDPLLNYMALTKNDANDGLQATDAFGVLADVAEECKVCVIVAHHVGKGASQKSANEVHLGSVMLKARARGYLYARKHPDDKGLVVVTDEKGSLLVPKGEAFAYRRLGMEVLFVKEFENPFDDQTPKHKGNNCRQWILDTLTDQWLSNSTLTLKAKNAGFSDRTFQRVRAELVKEGKILKGGSCENTQWCLAVDQPPYDMWGDQ
jgi:hypothetical protein